MSGRWHAFQSAAHAVKYARYRPAYNQRIIDTAIRYCRRTAPHLKLAVDAACGSGQSTLPLARHFRKVIGIDISEEQIRQAEERRRLSAGSFDNVEFAVCGAGDLGLVEGGSVDLVTCAQALHWLDVDRFYAEVDRVLVSGGCLVVYGYNLCSVDNQKAQELILEFYGETLKDWWDETRKDIENNYQDYELPYKGWERCDSHYMTNQIKVEDLIGYFETFSAYQKYIKEYPTSTVLNDLKQQLSQLYKESGDGAEPATVCVTWPVFMLMGHKE